MDARQVTFSTLIKLWEINALEPAVLFSTFYTGLTYGVYYSFFECVPLVYNDTYGYNLGGLGLSFLSVLCGLVVTVVILCAYFYYVQPKRLSKLDPVPPEARIWPGLFAILIWYVLWTVYFVFITFKHLADQKFTAWTARPSIHWMVNMVGIAISMCGVFVITQCMFIYLPFTYPHYAGSLFATNGFARSIFAAASILFSLPLFDGIQVSGGVTLLTSFSVACIFGMFALYFFGVHVSGNAVSLQANQQFITAFLWKISGCVIKNTKRS